MTEEATATTVYRGLVADDHQLIREGLVSMLSEQAHIEVIGEASDGLEVCEMAMEMKPDFILMDVSMPRLNGIAAVHRVSRDSPGTRVIMLSMHVTRQFVVRAIEAGAKGYLSKGASIEEVADAIDRVMRGGSYFSAEPSSVLASVVVDKEGGHGTVEPRLTSRQREIVQLLAEGHSSREIAELLNLSARTVDSHRANIFEALGVHDVTAVVRYAIRTGIIEA